MTEKQYGKISMTTNRQDRLTLGTTRTAQVKRAWRDLTEDLQKAGFTRDAAKITDDRRTRRNVTEAVQVV